MEKVVEHKITYREALRQGLDEALKNNEDVFLMGEDVGHYGGPYAVTKGFLEEFGPEKIMDVPLSEAGFTGVGIGAAMGGMRPIVEIMTVNFSLLALDQIANNAAAMYHMSGGQVSVPIVIRTSGGTGMQLAAQHSHSWEALFAHIPGIKVLAAGTHVDARYMLGEALKEKDPVIIFEYTTLLNTEERLFGTNSVDIEKAAVRRRGKDITLITYGAGLTKSMEAAKILAEENIDVEVVDLRVLRPIDTETIIESVNKTHRALVVEEAWKSGGISAEITSIIMTDAFYQLDAPVERLCGKEVHLPYPKHLEEAAIPQVQDIVNSVKKMIIND